MKTTQMATHDRSRLYHKVTPPSVQGPCQCVKGMHLTGENGKYSSKHAFSLRCLGTPTPKFPSGRHIQLIPVHTHGIIGSAFALNGPLNAVALRVRSDLLLGQQGTSGAARNATHTRMLMRGSVPAAPLRRSHPSWQQQQHGSTGWHGARC